MEHNMDKLLQSALTPDNIPEERLNRQIMHKATEKSHADSRTRENKRYSAESYTPSRRSGIFPTALAAVCILAIFTITLSAVIRNVDPILLSGETQPDYPTPSAPTEQTELPEETNPEETTFYGKLNEDSSTKEDRYKINVFLSNFSEQWFNQGSDTEFIRDKIDPDQLIHFAYIWYRLNAENSLDIDGSHAILTFDQVNYALSRYFDIVLSEKDFSYSSFEIRNQTIVMPYGAGESYPNFTITSEIIELGNGTYRVPFKIYSLIDAMSGGNKVTDKELYCLTEAEASQNSALEYHLSGYAIVRPYQENGIDSYQLISYWLNGQRWNCDYPNYSELLLPPREIGDFNVPDSVEGKKMLNSFDEDALGFPQWLTWGCIDWDGCAQFYSNAVASSTLESQIGISYSASNLTEFYRDTTWCEGVEGSGIGEMVEIKQKYDACDSGPAFFSEICIINGYAMNENKWQANNRVSMLRVYYGDTYVATLLLEDTIKPQFFDISLLDLTIGNGEEATFRFEIADVYPGTTYDDTCITGIFIHDARNETHQEQGEQADNPTDTRFPPKDVVVYMEGLPYSIPHIAGVKEPVIQEDGTVIAPGFVIYYDPAIYEIAEENGITYIRPSDPATEYPPCEMEIRHIPDVLPTAAAEKTRGEMVKTWSYVSEISDGQTRDCIYFSYHEETNWDAACGEIYFFSDGMGGTFQITSRYFIEATEGFGARANAMLDTFAVISE